ncbi:putative Type I protein exporter [Helianthus anomalus]
MLLAHWDTSSLQFVGELTALLTSDLGSFKNIVSENISRDRGFRALTEASYSTLCKSELMLISSPLSQ